MDKLEHARLHQVTAAQEGASSQPSLHARIAELEAALDDYEQCVSCDCCGALTDEPIDVGGHQQCKGCTMEAERDRTKESLRKAQDDYYEIRQQRDQIRSDIASSEALIDNMQREIRQLRAALTDIETLCEGHARILAKDALK